MARLPQPGGDNGQWGTILNDYLTQSHNADGSLKSGIVAETNLTSAVVTKLNSTGSLPDGSVTTTKLADGAVTNDKLDGATVTALDATIGTPARDRANHTGSQAISTVSGLQEALDGKAPAITIVASAANFAGIDDTGIATCSTAFQTAIDSLNDGDTLEVPAGKYRVSGLSSTGKTWHLRMLPGAEFIQASNVTVLQVRGAWDSALAVSAVGVETPSVGGETWQMATLTLASSPSWASGDVVKVFSDDFQWDGRPGDDTNPKQPYEGEFAVVWDVVGTKVRLKGPLRATYATNIRVARMQKTSFSVTNWKSGAEAVNWPTFTAGQLFLKSLYRPKVNGFNVNGGGGYACGFSSCLEWMIGPGFTVENLMNSGANAQFGYAISDSAGEGGRAVAPQVRSVRHAFTDASPNITAPSSDPGDYGRSRNCTVIAGFADSCTAAAWDTHHGGDGHEFVDCVAMRSTIGGQLRGRGHRFVNPKFLDCPTGFRAFTETVNSVRSFGHELINPTITATGEGIQVDIYERDDNNGTTLTVTGGRVRSKLAPVHAIHGHVVLRGGLDIGFSEASTGSLNAVYLEDSTAVIDGLIQDMNGLGLSGSGIRAARLADAACSLRGRDVRISHALVGSRMDAAFAGVSWGTAGHVDLENVQIDAPVTDIMRAVTSASRVAFQLLAGPKQVGLVEGSTVFVAAEPRRSSRYLGSFGTNPMVAALANTTTTTVNSANDAFLVPLTPEEDVTIGTLTWVAGGTSAGNFDIGIYTDSGTRLVSKGSTAWPAVSATMDVAISPVTLRAGTQYWLAFAADNASATFRGVLTAGLAQLQRTDGSSWTRRVASSFPLPASINPGSNNAARLPMITCRA